mmetsp:Transcript_46406/g.68539  ORF Transcript_46406/g.68539 Transcript_46406/m.68539 type:complete len:253 (-) Transcript_46406:276-1034(-)
MAIMWVDGANHRWMHSDGVCMGTSLVNPKMRNHPRSWIRTIPLRWSRAMVKPFINRYGVCYPRRKRRSRPAKKKMTTMIVPMRNRRVMKRWVWMTIRMQQPKQHPMFQPVDQRVCYHHNPMGLIASFQPPDSICVKPIWSVEMKRHCRKNRQNNSIPYWKRPRLAKNQLTYLQAMWRIYCQGLLETLLLLLLRRRERRVSYPRWVHPRMELIPRKRELVGMGTMRRISMILVKNSSFNRKESCVSHPLVGSL